MKPSGLQRFFSRFFPVTVDRYQQRDGQKLKLQFYKNQYQLAFGRVFYSDGHVYFPVKKSIEKIGVQQILDGQEFLALGSGLGSLSMYLHHNFPGKRLSVDYIEIHPRILQWCRELTASLSPALSHRYIQGDAIEWMKTNEHEYDYILLDIFEEHVVPMAVFKRPFIQQLYKSLKPGGTVILNLMFTSSFQEHEFEIKFSAVFEKFETINTRKNRIYIAQK